MFGMSTYKCYDCNGYFSLDGSLPIESTACPYCASQNIDHTSFVKNNGISNRKEAETVPDTNRKLIIKAYDKIKNFYPLYFIGPQDESELKPAGTISTQAMAQFHKQELLTEIPVTEIIETYFRHKWFLTDIKTSKFYELKTKPINQ